MGDWDAQFEKSLARFRREQSSVANPRAIAHVVAAAMTGLKRADLSAGVALQRLVSASESPIEEALCASLCFVAAYEQDYADAFVRLPGDGARSTWTMLPDFVEFGDDFVAVDGVTQASRPDRILIEPQAKIGSYRVDFLVRDGGQDESRSVFAVIECDGHDYHERTKEQAASDKARDRYMQAKGCLALRYTGAEIWADPIACAQNVFSVIDARLRDAVGGFRPARRKQRSKPQKAAIPVKVCQPRQEWSEPNSSAHAFSNAFSEANHAAATAVSRLPSDQQEAWAKIVAIVKARAPALGACLEFGFPLEVSPSAVRTGHPVGSFYARQLSHTTARTFIADAIGAVLGVGVPFSVVDVAADQLVVAKVG